MLGLSRTATSLLTATSSLLRRSSWRRALGRDDDDGDLGDGGEKILEGGVIAQKAMQSGSAFAG